MKRFFKYINIALLILIMLACSGDDKTVDDVLANVTSGAVLRTIDIDNNLVYNDITLSFETGSNYVLTIEEQDAQQGELLESIEISARFVENTRVDTNMDGTIDDDDANLTTQVGVIRTLTAADFQPGSRGVPITEITFTADELVAFTGVDETLIEGRDDFELNFLLTLTDGRTFSEDDASGNVSGGSYFSSPYTYRTPIACAITESLADTYTYQITALTSAPGGRSNCPAAPLSGQVTWEETDTPGEYTTSDISFGQFDSCYTDVFSSITFDDVQIVWDCINLIAEGTIETVETANGNEDEFSYVYTIVSTSGSDMTLDFSNSAGDRGTVILTRPDGKVWPALLTR